MEKLFLLIPVLILLATGCNTKQSSVNTPEPNVNNSSAAQSGTMKTFTNSKYGYTISYPSDIQGATSLCGGMGEDYVERAEVCNEVGFQLEPKFSSLYGSLYAVVVVNNGNLTAKDYLTKALSDAKITDQFIKTYNTKEGITAVFAGGLKHNPLKESDQGGGTLFDSKTGIILVPLANNKILRVTYPIEFCHEVKGQSLVSVPCYSDEKNTIFKQMANSLVIN